MAVSLLSGATAMSKVQAAGTAADVVAMAQSQIGYYEKASEAYLDDFTANKGSANQTKYARDMGVTNGQFWCATFVAWCMKSAGVPSSVYNWKAWNLASSSPSLILQGTFHYRTSGYTPKAGDTIYIDWASTGTRDGIDHMGIVESVSGNVIYTIEGNTGNNKVERRSIYRLNDSRVVGYGEINYSGTASTVTTNTSNPGAPYPIPTTTLQNGSTGDSVRWVQKFANDVLGAGLSVDGIYGARTVNVVRNFQSQHSLTVDGIAGTQTISKMLSVWQSKVAVSNPLDLGSEFAAIILRTDIWKSIKNDNGNVVLWDEKANAQYYWYFTRQSDGSYIIQSLYDGKVMDVYNAGTTNCTNVQTYGAWGTDNGAQKWYIYSSGSSYKLVPKCARNMCLDVQFAGTGNGTNIEIYENNNTVAQQFSIYKISHSALQSISIASDYSKTMEIGDKQTLKYNLSPSTTRCNIVKWSSSDASVLSIDNNGVVIAKKTGKATITCQSTFDSAIKGSVIIEVKNKEESTTQKTTTEEPKTEVTTEQTTEAPEAEESTTETPKQEESTTETPTTEIPDNSDEENYDEEDSTSDKDYINDDDTTLEDNSEYDEYEESEDSEDDFGESEYDDEDSDEDMEDNVNQDVPAVGTILKDTKNKCKVEITCNVEGCFTVEYVSSTKKNAKSITIPKSITIDGLTYQVTGIADDAFSHNTKLTKVTIGNNVRWIGDGAFENCKKLKSIVIPKSVEIIGKNAFRNCKVLKKITIKGTGLTKIGKHAFKNIDKKVKVVIPKSKKKEYKKMLKKAGCKV